ncbi:mevalonate kinase family protein [Tritonibacter aquimaris]|nr:mevalonate kinase [Tritonibacter aquimaris]
MIKASAPGSIMITGEHAVVYGHKAIVAAIEQRVFVTLTPRDDQRVVIRSEIADPLEIALADIAIEGPYRFVLAAVLQHRAQLPSGFALDIRSEINPTLGLGSSAAVTIACLGAIARYAGAALEDLHARAHKIILDIQGRGSGADLAASLTGGMISYDNTGEISPLPLPPQLGLKYCGYKTPTAVVLQRVAEDSKGREDEIATLYQDMGESAQHAIDAALTQDWQRFGAELTRYQGFMETLGVSDDVLDQIIADARTTAQATKISGSGLGDCVLSLGTLPQGFTAARVAEQGLIIDG